MPKYNILMGKRVPVDKYDTDHLLRLMLIISKRCNKFALKHTKGEESVFGDDGVWVARGFVSVGRPMVRQIKDVSKMKSRFNGRIELSTHDTDPLVAAEKFLTMLNEHEEKHRVLTPSNSKET